MRYEGNNQVSWSERPSARMYHSYPNEARNTSSGIVRNHEVSPIWLACALIAARFAPTKARTSTTVVIRSVGTPISSSSSRAASASSWKTPEYFLISSTRWSRSAVASYMRTPSTTAPARPAHPVHLHVVGMAVHAAFVVGGEDLGPFLGEDLRKARRGLVDVGLPERRGIVVPRRVRHARVAIPEERDARDTEMACGGPRLRFATLTERLAGPQEPGFDFAELAEGREHEHDAVARGGGTSHRSPGGDRLVVGMRVEEDDRPRWHGTIVARRPCDRSAVGRAEAVGFPAVAVAGPPVWMSTRGLLDLLAAAQAQRAQVLAALAGDELHWVARREWATIVDKLAAGEPASRSGCAAVTICHAATRPARPGAATICWCSMRAWTTSCEC